MNVVNRILVRIETNDPVGIGIRLEQRICKYLYNQAGQLRH